MKSVALPDELVIEVGEIARASGKTADQVVEDATRRYVAHERLDRFVDRNSIRARELGITESDVPGIVEQWRTEQR
jgi:predicted transcriptional regulator